MFVNSPVDKVEYIQRNGRRIERLVKMENEVSEFTPAKEALKLSEGTLTEIRFQRFEV